MKTSGGVYDHAIRTLEEELEALRWQRGLYPNCQATFDERIADVQAAINDLGRHMSYLTEEEIEQYRAETERETVQL